MFKAAIAASTNYNEERMNKLKLWRLERGLSQVDLSQATGIYRWNIQLIELGIRPPTPEQMQTLSEALGAPIEKLFPIDTRENRVSIQNAMEEL